MRMELGCTLVFAFVLGPTIAAAQACVGVPAPRQGYALEIGASRSGDVTYYDTRLNANFAGAPFASASYRLGDIDDIGDNAHRFATSLGMELNTPTKARFCPVAEIGYERVGTALFGVEFGGSAVTFGGGIGIGGEFESGTVRFVPYVIPEVMWGRVRTEVTVGTESVRERESKTILSGVAGVAVVFGQVHIRPSITIADYDDTEVAFGVTAGVSF